MKVVEQSKQMKIFREDDGIVQQTFRWHGGVVGRLYDDASCLEEFPTQLAALVNWRKPI